LNRNLTGVFTCAINDVITQLSTVIAILQFFTTLTANCIAQKIDEFTTEFIVAPVIALIRLMDLCSYLHS
jgi:hypothetical protein